MEMPVDSAVWSRVLRTVREEGGFAFVVSAEKAAAGDVEAAEAAREMAWEQLHCGPWHAVVPAWRDAYAMACLYLAKLKAGKGEHSEALRLLDMGVIMGGGMLREELEREVKRIREVEVEVEVEGRGEEGGNEGWRWDGGKSLSLAEVSV